MTFERMFEKGRIGGLTIRNRTVMPPMGTDFANHDGTASMRLIRYYEERAKGGVGLVINEYTGVDETTSVPTNYNLRISQDWHIASCEQLTEAVHRHGALIFAQLHHGGSTSKPALTGRQSISASDVPAVPGAPAPRPMTVGEISAIVRKFTEAAIRCKKAGYDGVELHGAHSYLIGQFFSPYYNKRTDEYGGSFEGRMRFIDEIIDGIRAELGTSFPLSVRICGDEMTPGVPGTLGLADGLAIGRHLQDKGIDAINISNGSALNGSANCDPYSCRPGWKKHVARAFKEALFIPVIATNTIKDPYFAESLLKEGVCDFVALGRSLIADPDFVRKALEGKPEEIRPCIGCMYCRERLLVHGNSVSCAVNPRMGREYILKSRGRDGDLRPVVVAGGGPAGMECARVLAERGFRVTLYEKGPALGGALNIADKPPRKELITKLTDYMADALDKLGVNVRLNTEATPETVRRLSPLGVFVACGASPVVPNLPGIRSEGVFTAEDFIMGKAKPAGRTAVIGTGLTGLEAADMLTEMGRELILVEMMDRVGPGLFAVVLDDIMGRINRGNPAILTSHRLVSIKRAGSSLKIMLKHGDSDVSLEADSVALALGVSPDAAAVEKFEREFGAHRVFAVGNASRSGRIAEAIRSGFERAFAFEP
ncbi:MAG: NAD(P)/FAD-dependent oxidoreductase [Synergistaceae bacterium]|jgi:2,4-dienoyl-CoA reductase-like NADH-dependent reductase (Old Yellow Enzyme family)/thioredoxin reductase|nr:NAD(P)/FAD-dependent oxidoreductase [Synergistaceae bacterium]